LNQSSGQLAASYPPEIIDFDSANVPEPVVAALEEAITCHANACYVAAAMMVRKTLEELCGDRGAAGANLKERLKALGGKVVLPQELLDGLDDLRLLGNDATHFDSQVYNKVGREEVELGVEFTKEVLKGVYQMSWSSGPAARPSSATRVTVFSRVKATGAWRATSEGRVASAPALRR